VAPSNTPDAAMADVWSIPVAETEPPTTPSPPPSPVPLEIVEAVAAVAPPPSAAQEIKAAAVAAAVAAAEPPVPPATSTGYSSDFFTACSRTKQDALDIAAKAAKQAGCSTAQAAGYRTGRLGEVDEAAEIDASVANTTADVYAHLVAKAPFAVCVTRTTAVSACFTTSVILRYVDVADKVKRDIRSQYKEAVDMCAEFISDFPCPPKF